MFGRMAGHDAGGIDRFAAAEEVKVKEGVDCGAVWAEIGDEGLSGHGNRDAMVLNDDARKPGLRRGVKFARPDAMGNETGDGECGEQEQSGGP